MKLTRYKLETEKIEEIDSYRLRRERILMKLEESIEKGWKTASQQER
jgi:hypothetical protein